MKFSSQEEYGLRCLLHIARSTRASGTGASVTIGEISRAEGLSTANVGKLLRILRLAGVVTSERGREGGYSLATVPEEIRIGTVLDHLGGRIVAEEFCSRHSGTRPICVHSVDCSVISLWERVQTAVDDVLLSTTLADLLPEDEAASIQSERVELSAD